MFICKIIRSGKYRGLSWYWTTGLPSLLTACLAQWVARAMAWHALDALRAAAFVHGALLPGPAFVINAVVIAASAWVQCAAIGALSKAGRCSADATARTLYLAAACGLWLAGALAPWLWHAMPITGWPATPARPGYPGQLSSHFVSTQDVLDGSAPVPTDLGWVQAAAHPAVWASLGMAAVCARLAASVLTVPTHSYHWKQA